MKPRPPGICVRRVLGLLRALIADCEIHLQKDGTDWRFSAKGALGIAALLIRSGARAPYVSRRGPGGAIVEAASQRVTRLGEVLARRRPPIASPSSRRMPEPNTSDRNSHGSRVHEISDRKIAARFSRRLPTTRCGEEDRRLLRFSNGFWFLRSRSITHADRDGGRKLARLRRGFCFDRVFRKDLAVVGDRVLLLLGRLGAVKEQSSHDGCGL